MERPCYTGCLTNIRALWRGLYCCGGWGDWQGMMNRLLIPLHLLPSPLTVSTSLHLIATTQTPLISRTFCAQKDSFLYLFLTVSKLYLLKSFAFIHFRYFLSWLLSLSFNFPPLPHRTCCVSFISREYCSQIEHSIFSLCSLGTYLLNGCETTQVLIDISLIRSFKIGTII